MELTIAACSAIHTQLYFTTNVVAKKTYIIKHKLNKWNKWSLNYTSFTKLQQQHARSTYADISVNRSRFWGFCQSKLDNRRADMIFKEWTSWGFRSARSSQSGSGLQCTTIQGFSGTFGYSQWPLLLAVCCTFRQGCSRRDRGLGLESTRYQFYAVLVLVLVLRGKVLVLVLVLTAKVLVLVLVLRGKVLVLSLIHIWRCRRSYACRSRWSPYH